jgi:hypothetical protein
VLQYTFLVIYIRLYRKQQRTAQDDVYRYITRRSIIVDSRLDILSTIVVRIMHAIQSIQRWCEESDFSSWHENFNKSLIEIYIKECCAFYVTWHSSQRDFFQVGSLLNPTRHQFKTYIYEYAIRLCDFENPHERMNKLNRGIWHKYNSERQKRILGINWCHDFWWFDSELWKEQPRNNHREILCAVIFWKGYSTEFHHVFIYYIETRGGFQLLLLKKKIK